ncbi:hypothetical protein D3C87_1217590 [compost metagenome]
MVIPGHQQRLWVRTGLVLSEHYLFATDEGAAVGALDLVCQFVALVETLLLPPAIVHPDQCVPGIVVVAVRRSTPGVTDTDQAAERVVLKRASFFVANQMAIGVIVQQDFSRVIGMVIDYFTQLCRINPIIAIDRPV